MAAELKPVQYEFHPVANIFPLMSEDEFAALVDDIKKHGLRELIWLYDGKIIDGRNRYRACREAGEAPRFRHYTDDAATLVDFVVSQNLHRRHLSASQKAMLGAQIEQELGRQAKERQRLAAVRTNEKTGRSTQTQVQKIAQASTPQMPKGKARDQAAKLAGVNRQYVSDAKQIIAKAPEVAARVKAGTMEMQDAKAIASLPASQRQTALDVLDNGAAKNGRKAAAMVRQAAAPATEQLEIDDVMPASKFNPFDLEGRAPADFRQSTTAQGAMRNFLGKEVFAGRTGESRFDGP